ncbi:hypothetical protein BDV29DRAFT_161147 [Aspergillus leporis]|jgi:cholinesterase|uniref:Uncharacterized protein n=1 Tax=Aspergillus leporis TaxID=41062 RepID=A0A5N5WMK7_9EURO|nr:hypothetical protein BDV29DRAFT_161147 [Aspergillus leporis]
MLLKAYLLGAPGAHTENDRISLIANERFVHCPIMWYVNDSSHIPTWRYFFNASFPDNEVFSGSGAFHDAEIPFVFGTYSQKDATEFEHQVSQGMQKAWADSAKDPIQGPGWNRFPAIGIFRDGGKDGMDEREEVVECSGLPDYGSAVPGFSVVLYYSWTV